MRIDQIGIVDASPAEFAHKKSGESIPANDGGFASHLAEVMDPQGTAEKAQKPETKTTDAPAKTDAPDAGDNGHDHRHMESAKTTSPDDPVAGTRGETQNQAQKNKLATNPGYRSVAATTTAGLRKRVAAVQVVPSPGKTDETVKAGKTGDVAPRLQKSIKSAFVSETGMNGRTVSSAAAPPEPSGDEPPKVSAGAEKSQKQMQTAGARRPAAEIEVVAASVNPVVAEAARIPGDNVPGKTDNEPGKQDLKAGDVELPQAPLNRRRPKIEVRDLRPISQKAEAATEAAVDTRLETPKELPAETVRIVAGESRTQGTAHHSVVRTQPASSATLESLRQTLSEQTNAEIVKAARFIVRGNETGEIRLNLRPESLGSVRISLQLEEGHIAGRIFVENVNVKGVFEQNLADLVRAFNASGLETGSLDVMLDNAGDDGPGHGRGRSHVVRHFDDAVPLVQTFVDDHELIDLVV